MDLSPSVQEALAASEARFRALVQHSTDVAAIIDVSGTVQHVSRPALDVGGRAIATFTGTNVWDLVHPDDRPATHAVLAEVVAEPGTTRSAEMRIERADGVWRWVEVVATNLIHEPAVAGIVVNVRDITRRKRAEAELYHRAHHDQLTGLPNRSLLLDRMARSSAASSVALLLLDVDEFKLINDTHGHAVGDTLLCMVASRLRDAVRQGDTVARLGGDEFVILCPDIDDAADAAAVAAQVKAAFAPAFDLAPGVRYRLDATVGIAMGEPGVDPARLLADADTAMYATKRRGRGGHGLFDEGVRRAATARRALDADLLGAVERGEIICHYQPIVDLATGRAVAVEALARWRHPTRGLLMPGAWLPAVTTSTLVVDMGRALIEQVARDVTRRMVGGRTLPVTINLSARELLDDELLAHVERVLQRTGLAPGQLSFDITEAAVNTDTTRAFRALARLRTLGIRLALDDFGTGPSSLAYLKQLPVDVVKLDASLVHAAASDADIRDIMATVTQLGGLLGRTVLAEGVEDDAHHDVVLAAGCRLGQGFRWSPAVPVDELDDVLTLLAARGASSGARQ
jgi:diguanylate cyclase (GGDEF)-like protein/PAS domain S-box-containing protein